MFDHFFYVLILVNIEVQRWHGGHYMVSGGNDGLDRTNVLSVYLFFSQCFGEMTDVKDDLHYVFEERDTLAPVVYSGIIRNYILSY